MRILDNVLIIDFCCFLALDAAPSINHTCKFELVNMTDHLSLVVVNQHVILQLHYYLVAPTVDTRDERRQLVWVNIDKVRISIMLCMQVTKLAFFYNQLVFVNEGQIDEASHSDDRLIFHLVSPERNWFKTKALGSLQDFHGELALIKEFKSTITNHILLPIDVSVHMNQVLIATPSLIALKVNC